MGGDGDLRELELAEVVSRRYEEARQAGMSVEDATRFAEAHAEIDVGTLREAVKRGCPPELLAGIVL